MLGSLGVMSIPAFFIFFDYHKRSNIHKAVAFVTALFASAVLVVILPPGLVLALAMATPFLVLAYVLLARRQRG